MGLKKKDHKGEGEEQRVIDFGHSERNPPFADNSVKTSKYTWLSFFPYVSLLLLFFWQYFPCSMYYPMWMYYFIWEGSSEGYLSAWLFWGC